MRADRLDCIVGDTAARDLMRMEMPDKTTFDWMRQQLNGFMRTQIIAAAATLSLAEHLQNGPRMVEEIASMAGLTDEMTFRLLRALAAIGLVASENERTFQSLPPLETLLSTEPGSLRELAMGFATPAQYLPWNNFLHGAQSRSATGDGGTRDRPLQLPSAPS